MSSKGKYRVINVTKDPVQPVNTNQPINQPDSATLSTDVEEAVTQPR